MNHTFEYFENALAIFPTVKGFGYAFFRDEHEPKQTGVAIIKNTEPDKYLKRIDAMVQTYQPKIILIPTPDTKNNHKTKRTQQFLKDIIEYAKQQDIIIKTFSREQIRMVFERFDAFTKLEISEKICLWMPDLEKYKPRQRKSYMPEEHYQGMFDAISLFITHLYIDN